ncbi:MAG: peptidase T [Clostridia bacterium]|nr:peptidase T [Clostridia bacterium]
MQAYERFLKYVAFPTMSDETSESCPSTVKQLELAKYLAAELESLGLTEVKLDQHGYLYATLEANCDTDAPVIGFIAHMDTSDEAADSPIKPAIVEYNGGDILLNADKDIVLKVADYPYLSKYIGNRIIVTDGTTLLGADDKAGIAAIVTALEHLIASGKPHGKIRVGFTPDEEIGRGADLFDVEGFGCQYAYTVDGGALGELEYENFNGASAVAEIAGVSIHPGSAKDKMINAALVATEFASLLPQDQTPATTEGYQGFFHLTSIGGATESAKVSYIIRDHDMEQFQARKALFAECGHKINAKYGPGTCKVTITDSYYNMREKIAEHMYIIDRAKEAMGQAGVTPLIQPIRGGTDGARLSYEGLPCPNLFTGGENFHSRFEFLPIESLDKACQVVENIICMAVK